MRFRGLLPLSLTLVQGEDTYAYTYNGLGVRLSQTVNGDTTNYTLDINRSLTEVLQDGDSTYLYGLGRIGEDRGDTMLYHIPDALGSVRQLADSESQILFAQSYEPFGDVLEAYGAEGSTYGFTGQMVDENGLVYLRARYYNTGTGRFFTRDPWSGSALQPMSYDPYLYAYNNPIIYTDPSGRAVSLIAAAGVGLAGIGVGALVGWKDYDWAISGSCGCDIQELALSMDRLTWASMHAMAGGTIGLLAPIVAPIAATNVGALVFGGTQILLSGKDLLRTWEIIHTETGWTWCTGIRFSVDLIFMLLGVVGVAKGASGIVKTVKAWRASGSVIESNFPGNVGYPEATADMLGETPSELLVEPNGEFYSVGYEYELDPLNIGTTHSRHTYAANKALLADIEAYPEYASTMEELIPGITNYLRAGKNPPEWVWHHHPFREGILQLVPQEQHIRGSIFWDTLHPGGFGGWHNWAVPAGATR